MELRVRLFDPPSIPRFRRQIRASERISLAEILSTGNSSDTEINTSFVSVLTPQQISLKALRYGNYLLIALKICFDVLISAQRLTPLLRGCGSARGDSAQF